MCISDWSSDVCSSDLVYAPVDAADRQSAHPAFAGLVYPVIDPAFGTSGNTFKNLLGPKPDPAIAVRYTIDKRVTAETPPLFFVQAMDDGLVDPGNTLSMLAACRPAHVPEEAPLVEKGGPGFGPVPEGPGAVAHTGSASCRGSEVRGRSISGGGG